MTVNQDYLRRVVAKPFLVWLPELAANGCKLRAACEGSDWHRVGRSACWN